MPSDLGWDLVNVLSRLTHAPDALLNLISCNCKYGCESGCGCIITSCVLWYANSVVVLVLVILHNQMMFAVELDAHQDEDRTDPERTEDEGDI